MNYEKKFTPGPWHIDDDGDVSSIDMRTICEIEPLSRNEWKFNSHLISSAPELLDAMIDVLELASAYGMKGSIYDKCILSVNKALNIKNS
jgi:hypothetical protein